MRRNERDGPTRAQKSISFYQDGRDAASGKFRERSRLHELTYPQMLIEDVYSQIMPLSAFSTRAKIRVALVPPSAAAEGIVASALSSRERSRRHELGPAVCDFMRKCVQTMMVFGEAVYEIVYLTENESGIARGFELQYVPPMTVTRKGGLFIQHVPDEIAREHHVPTSIALPAQSVLIFEPPASRRQQISRATDALARLSGNPIPDFAFEDGRRTATTLQFDSGNHAHAQELALAEATRAIGWSARGLLQDCMSDVYRLRRELRFERFKIEMRTAILETLNIGLRRTDGKLAGLGQIEISGLPTARDVSSAEEQLEAGGTPFGQIINPFLQYR